MQCFLTLPCSTINSHLFHTTCVHVCAGNLHHSAVHQKQSVMTLVAGSHKISPILCCEGSYALLLSSPGQCRLSKQCIHAHNCQHMVCYCRLGNLEEVCAFASPASHGAANKFGFTPMSAHFRPLMGHEAAQVVMTMQTLPEKATVVIGMFLLSVVPTFTTLCMPQVACNGDIMASVLLPQPCFLITGLVAYWIG